MHMGISDTFTQYHFPDRAEALEKSCKSSADRRFKACPHVLDHVNTRPIATCNITIGDLEKKTQEAYLIDTPGYLSIESATPDLSVLLVQLYDGNGLRKSLCVLDRVQGTLTTYLRPRRRDDNDGDATGFSDASMSSDGKWISYRSSDVRGKGTTMEIYTIERETGKHTNITRSQEDESSPFFSSDGLHIGYVKYDLRETGIYSYSIKTHKTHLLQILPSGPELDANDVRAALEGKKIIKQSVLSPR
jgi:hypothetical protein